MAAWNDEISSAELDGPLALGARAKIVFRTGLRLRFRVVEFEEGRLFTDEARLPGARMGHRHLVEATDGSGSRLTNTIYIEGPLAWLWRRVMGPGRRGPSPPRSGRWRSWPSALGRAGSLTKSTKTNRAVSRRPTSQ